MAGAGGVGGKSVGVTVGGSGEGGAVAVGATVADESAVAEGGAVNVTGVVGVGGGVAGTPPWHPATSQQTDHSRSDRQRLV